MIDNSIFSQTNPTPSSARNSPSLSSQLSNLNNEVTAIEDTIIQGYVREGAGITRLSANSFSVTGDVTNIYTAGRILRLNVSSTPVYMTVASASFGGSVTTITLQESTVPDPLNIVDIAIQPRGKTTQVLYSPDIRTPTILKPTVRGSLQAINAPSFNANLTLDLAQHNIFIVNGISDDITLALSNVSVGQEFKIRLGQDSGGGHSVTWWSGINWDESFVPDLSADANKADWFAFLCTGTGAYDGWQIGRNMG